MSNNTAQCDSHDREKEVDDLLNRLNFSHLFKNENEYNAAVETKNKIKKMINSVNASLSKCNYMIDRFNNASCIDKKRKIGKAKYLRFRLIKIRNKLDVECTILPPL